MFLVIMCAGFFLIAALEEAIHHLLHPATTTEAKEEAKEEEQERSTARAKAAIRSVFVVFALSFHSIVEGERERRHHVLALLLYFFSYYANECTRFSCFLVQAWR